MQQEQALEIMMRGDNVILTGPAGAGKSYLLYKFINKARKHKKKVVVTATTGLAAAHLGGQTLHSWSGIGLANHLHDDYIYMMSDARKKAIRKTDVLIIDEVSMMHDYNLDMVDKAMRIVRENDEVMGGLQVILCGDFFQLPPVMQGGNGKFITHSEVWDKLNLSVCYLEEQHRADDLQLQEILNAMRAGDMRNRHLRWLLARRSVSPSKEVTKLYTLNKDVDTINQQELAKVPGDSHYYLRTSRGKWEAIENLQRNVLAPDMLELKLGAMVMAVKNDPEKRYHNGSIGYVIDFTDEGFPIVKFKNPIIVYPDEWELKSGDRVTAAITQIPLRLAYAITVHKSQGMTLDAAEIDLSNAFVEGMGYVGLSRVKNLDNLYLKGINKRALMVSSEAQIIDKELRERSRRLL
jgi:ATP-dependent DNA helicase PIF1